MAEFAGSAVLIQWIWASGTVSIHTDQRNYNYAPSIDFIDATAGADTARQRVNSFKDGSLTVSTLAQDGASGTALMAACAEGNSGTIILAPNGTVAGNVKRTIPAICQGVTSSASYNDVTVYDISWQQNGARTDGAY